MDVLIVDCLNIPPLSAESHFKIFPAEAVVGAIEITSAPKATVVRAGVPGRIPKLQDDIGKLAKLRGIAQEREYIRSLTVVNKDRIELRDFKYSYILSPRSFLITCGDEWMKPETYRRHLLESMNSAKEKHEHVWLNAAFSMRHGMFHFKPFTDFEHEHVRENALLEFVFYVDKAISEFHTSPIDLRRYRPTIPVDSSNG